MEYVYRNAGKSDENTRVLIKVVVEKCAVCNQTGRSRSKPVVAILRASNFNAVVTLDLKEFDRIYVLWMVCALVGRLSARSLSASISECQVPGGPECQGI